MTKIEALVAERMARRLHDLYEQMAPGFGYETREDTRAFIPESPNGKLMIAVCTALAASPEVAKLIREAEARGMERAAKEAREMDYPWSLASNEQGSACDQMAERIADWLERCAINIRAEAAALKGACHADEDRD